MGSLGERRAALYLRLRGYSIKARNYRAGHHEIDIVASRMNEIVFVEVKTRHDKCLVDPEVTVDIYKQRHLIWAANSYVNRYQYDLDVRFDIIAITIDKNNEKKIEHIVDAFYPSVRIYK